MERISAAIARAKQSRREPGGHSPGLRNGHRSSLPSVGPVDVRYTTTPVISVNPAHLIANKVFAFDQNDPNSRRFDILRTQVLQSMEKEGLQTLGITSPTMGCGKTVVSLNLGLAMARQFNHTVLLVDFDLKKPSIASCLGLQRRPGLKDYLDGQVQLAEALVNPGFDRFVVLPNFERVPGSSEKIMSKQVSALVNELKSRYRNRIVIFDLPPLLTTDDVIAFLPLLDCSLLVASVGVSSIPELEECAEALQDTRNLGVVLNRGDSFEAGYPSYPAY